MFIRFKRWLYLTPLAPHVALCGSGRRYVWTGAESGAVQVPFKVDVEWLLNPPGNATSAYEIAYERHGIHFDASGKELDTTKESSAPRTVLTVTNTDSLTSTAAVQVIPIVRRGRPKKS